MRKWLIVVAMFFINVTSIQFACAEEFASKSDAEAIVKRAIEHVKSVGLTQAAEDFTNRKGDFVKSDLYVTMYDLEGLVLAHGQNRKSVGKNLIEQKDVDGKEYIRERMVLAKTKNKFWQDFKFSDPITKKVLPKEMYCETLPNTVVCAGVYKR
jgi:signal transduction histidine kinase